VVRRRRRRVFVIISRGPLAAKEIGGSDRDDTPSFE
jgi:hypothetical protein